MSGVRRLRERWVALLFVWLWQLAAATLLAAPLVTAIAGTGVRRSLVLILQDATKPRSTMATDWTPRKLCGR